MIFRFDHSYARELPGFYVKCKPARSPEPSLLYFNQSLAEELQLDLDKAAIGLADIFSGNRLPDDAEPIAQAYAGHQFGHFSPQLGDGRALLIGEVIDKNGHRRDIAFKGSGRTPFSRSGDGKAAIGPMLREVLISEAMHALGIPTTRALAVAATGDIVYRQTSLPGAVLTRVAASHIRVGTFEFFAARGAYDQVRQLADYTIARHYPTLTGPQKYLEFLREVVCCQSKLIAQWMGIGFIHGVMNTDNMSIAGETIDYGPCAFMESYDPETVYSSIDEYGRYAYVNQPRIAQWNITRLAETLIPLLAEDEKQAIQLATDAIESFTDIYQADWLQVMLAKLGLNPIDMEAQSDSLLIGEWLDLLEKNQLDFTLAWRSLADAAEGQVTALAAMFVDVNSLNTWIEKWQDRCKLEDESLAGSLQTTDRANRMRAVNPYIIPRNHQVEAALEAASTNKDFSLFQQLLVAIQSPYAELPESRQFAEPAPHAFTQSYRTFCGT